MSTKLRKLPPVRPETAAFWAWLVPGSGHLIQGRISKGIVFMLLLWGSFIYGMYLGEGRVVYLKWDEDEKRLPYFAQLGSGIAALPGLVQWLRHRRDAGPWPWLGKFEYPPDKVELDELHHRLGRRLELGTLYTMMAGLLNVLVICDVLSGAARRDESVVASRAQSSAAVS